MKKCARPAKNISRLRLVRSIEASPKRRRWKMPAIDFVTAGQAFHWFRRGRSGREFRRILKPDGWIVVVWNDRQMDSPFATAYEDILVKYRNRLQKGARGLSRGRERCRNFSRAASVQQRIVPNAQILDLDGLIGRDAQQFVRAAGRPSKLRADDGRARRIISRESARRPREDGICHALFTTAVSNERRVATETANEGCLQLAEGFRRRDRVAGRSRCRVSRFRARTSAASKKAHTAR